MICVICYMRYVKCDNMLKICYIYICVIITCGRLESQVKAVRALKERAQEFPMFEVRSDEDIITNGEDCVKRLCAFLGLPCTDEFAQTCAGIVYKKSHKSRFEFQWREEEKKQVADLIDQTEWFKGYTFDN